MTQDVVAKARAVAAQLRSRAEDATTDQPGGYAYVSGGDLLAFASAIIVLVNEVESLRDETEGFVEDSQEWLRVVLETCGDAYVRGHDTWLDDGLPRVGAVVRERNEARARVARLEETLRPLAHCEQASTACGACDGCRARAVLEEEPQADANVPRQFVQEMERLRTANERLAQALKEIRDIAEFEAAR